LAKSDKQPEKAISKQGIGAAARSANSAGSGVGPLDLLGLANSTVDAAGNLRVAKSRYARLSELSKKKVVSPEEIEIAEAEVQTSQRKLEILHAMTEIALKSAKEEMTVAKKEYDTGLISHEQLGAIEARVHMLNLILDSGR